MNDVSEHDRPDRDDPVGRLISMAGPRPAAPGDIAARVKVAVHAAWESDVRARRTRRRVLLIALPVAASLALAVAGSVWRRSTERSGGLHPSVPAAIVARLEAAAGGVTVVPGAGDTRPAGIDIGAPISAGVTVVTAASSLAAFRTPDGVSLRVGASTRLGFLAATEWQLERGVVYVDHPPSRGTQLRLAVRTPFATVRDTGTQFEVRVDRSSLRLRVREGEASIERAAGIESVAAGAELRLDADGRVGRRAVPTHGPDWAWVARLATPIDIEGRPLGDMLAWATREMGWRLEFGDARLAQTAPAIVLHGSVSGLAPDEALAAVLATCGLTSHVEAGVLFVRESPGAHLPASERWPAARRPQERDPSGRSPRVPRP